MSGSLMTSEVTLSLYVKWASAADPVEPSSVPADLAEAMTKLAAGMLDEAAACEVARRYVVANFLVENLASGTELFVDAVEVWATEIEVNKLRVVEGEPLPRITAAAAFRLKITPAFPLDEDAMAAWSEQHGYLIDGANFFWRFGATDIVLGYEEAGGGVEDFPHHLSNNQ